MSKLSSRIVDPGLMTTVMADIYCHLLFCSMLRIVGSPASAALNWQVKIKYQSLVRVVRSTSSNCTVFAHSQCWWSKVVSSKERKPQCLQHRQLWDWDGWSFQGHGRV